jgi:hypothetical protein
VVVTDALLDQLEELLVDDGCYGDADPLRARPLSDDINWQSLAGFRLGSRIVGGAGAVVIGARPMYHSQRSMRSTVVAAHCFLPARVCQLDPFSLRSNP